MAVKSTVAKKATKAKVSTKKTKAKSKPTGLHRTAAQWKAYQKAYTAAYQNTRLNNAARAMRANRLLAANKSIQQYSSARRKAQAASVASFAATMTSDQAGDASQNAALRNRVNDNLRQHLSVLNKAQYAEASTRQYMQQAVQRTQTGAEARTYEEKAFHAATRISKISYRLAPSAIAASVKASAQAQSTTDSGRTAPGAKTSTTAARGRTSIHATSVHQSGKANRSARTGQKSQAAVAKSSARQHQSSAKSVKAPVATFKARTAPKPVYTGEAPWASVIFQSPMRPVTPRVCFDEMFPVPLLNEFTGWYSNEYEPTCILSALANHLLLTTGFHLYQHEMKMLYSGIRYMRSERLLPRGADILTALMAAKQWGFSDRLGLKGFWPARICDPITPGMIVGFEAETGPHAALLVPGHRVISWGEEMPLTASIEEAWILEWEVYGGRAD